MGELIIFYSVLFLLLVSNWRDYKCVLLSMHPAELVSAPLSLWQLQMWTNALWIGPVTTAASTTLAHSRVLATKGTPSTGLPTVEVSRIPLELDETGPAKERSLPLNFPQIKANFPTLWVEQNIPVPVQQERVHWFKGSIGWGKSPHIYPLTRWVWNGAERRAELFQLWIHCWLYRCTCTQRMEMSLRSWYSICWNFPADSKVQSSERLGRSPTNSIALLCIGTGCGALVRALWAGLHACLWAGSGTISFLSLLWAHVATYPDVSRSYGQVDHGLNQIWHQSAPPDPQICSAIFENTDSDSDSECLGLPRWFWGSEDLGTAGLNTSCPILVNCA